MSDEPTTDEARPADEAAAEPVTAVEATTGEARPADEGAAEPVTAVEVAPAIDAAPAAGATETVAAAPEDEAPPAPKDVRRYLPWLGLVVAFWATLPKYSGPTLHIKGGAATEVVDHVVPGIIIAIAALVCIAMWQRAGGPGLVPFACGALTLLCGFWMVATHWQLILQATRNQAPWAGAIYHTTAAVAVFGFGLLWTVSHWPDLSAAMAEDDRRRAQTVPAE